MDQLDTGDKFKSMLLDVRQLNFVSGSPGL